MPNANISAVYFCAGWELFFHTADNQIAALAYTLRGDSHVADKPRLWSEYRLANAFNNGSNFDLAPDGKRFVVFMPAEAPEEHKASEIIFLENFFDELRRKVPQGK
jgi:hypothetical protein